MILHINIFTYKIVKHPQFHMFLLKNVNPL